MGTSPVPQHPQAGPSGQTQAPWMQPGLSPAQTFQIRNGGGPQLPARGPSQPQNIQSSPLIHPAGAQPNLGPQRPGSTSHQVLSGQLPNQTTPNQFSGGQFGSSAMPNGQNANQMVPPPLDKAKFEESYAAFCSTRPIVRDERAMQIDNRPIDLHSLHANVLTEGGAEKVSVGRHAGIRNTLMKLFRLLKGKCGPLLVLAWDSFNFQVHPQNLRHLGRVLHNNCKTFTANTWHNSTQFTYILCCKRERYTRKVVMEQVLRRLATPQTVMVLLITVSRGPIRLAWCVNIFLCYSICIKTPPDERCCNAVC